MKKLKQKLIILLTLFVIVIGFGSWMVLTRFFPKLAFADYPVIPIFFFITGIVTIGFLTRLNYDNSLKLLNKIMLIRGLKTLATILFGLIYWLLDRTEIRSFVIMLATFYLFYLFFEVYIFGQIEKWHKHNSNRQLNLKNEK